MAHPSKLELSDVALFARVARFASFSKAAAFLGKPKSTLSRRVSALESELGIRLVERSSRAFRLTEAGKAYFERVEPIVTAAEQASLELASARDRASGVLRVTTPVSFGGTYLGPIVAQYLQRNPQVQVELLLVDRKVDLVGEGFDVGVRIGLIDEPASTVIRKLGSIPTVLLASLEYLERRGTPKTVEDLAQHDCVLFEREANRWRLSSASGATKVAQVKGRVAANEMRVVLELVTRGLGIGCVPHLMALPAIAQGAARVVLDAYHPPPIELYAVLPSKKQLPMKTRAFIDLLAERAKDADWVLKR